MTRNKFFTGLAVVLAVYSNLGYASAQSPSLNYDPANGNVLLLPAGNNITSWNIQSADQFTPPASFVDLEASTFNVPGLSDNLPSAIGWVSAVAAGGNGFGDRPEDEAGANLGNIFPTGLDQSGLDSLLTNNAWAGPGGTSGAFALVLGADIVPEPTTFALLGLGGLGILILRRRD